MSAVDDVGAALDAVLEQLALAETATNAADAVAARGLDLAETVGLPATIAKLRRVKVTTAAAADEIEAVRCRLERARQVVRAMTDPE